MNLVNCFFNFLQIKYNNKILSHDLKPYNIKNLNQCKDEDFANNKSKKGVRDSYTPSLKSNLKNAFENIKTHSNKIFYNERNTEESVIYNISKSIKTYLQPKNNTYFDLNEQKLQKNKLGLSKNITKELSIHNKILFNFYNIFVILSMIGTIVCSCLFPYAFSIFFLGFCLFFLVLLVLVILMRESKVYDSYSFYI